MLRPVSFRLSHNFERSPRQRRQTLRSEWQRTHNWAPGHGAFLIAYVEMFGAAYRSPQMRDVYVFGILIAVLILKPGGLLGKATVEKV